MTPSWVPKITRSARRHLTILLVLTLAGCTGLPHASVMGAPADDAAEVRRARVAQEKAIVDGDLATVAAYWTPDVQIRRGLGAVLIGRDAYLTLFDATTQPKVVYTRRPIAVEVSHHWPLAFETGEWSAHEQRPSAPAIIRGRYSAQWVKREGRWLIRSEVFVALSCAGSGCAMQAVP